MLTAMLQPPGRAGTALSVPGPRDSCSYCRRGIAAHPPPPVPDGPATAVTRRPVTTPSFPPAGSPGHARCRSAAAALGYCKFSHSCVLVFSNLRLWRNITFPISYHVSSLCLARGHGAGENHKAERAPGSRTDIMQAMLLSQTQIYAMLYTQIYPAQTSRSLDPSMQTPTGCIYNSHGPNPTSTFLTSR